MPFPRAPFAAFVLAALPLLPSCATSPATAGSIAVPAGSKRTLHVRSEFPREMRLHLWSRGPGTVLFTPIAPLPLEPETSALEPKSGDFHWQVTGSVLSIELRGLTEDATVGYELHTNGKVTVEVQVD